METKNRNPSPISLHLLSLSLNISNNIICASMKIANIYKFISKRKKKKQSRFPFKKLMLWRLLSNVVDWQ